VHKEVSQLKSKDWDKQNKEPELPESDKADPSHHSSRISPAQHEPAREGLKKETQPWPMQGNRSS
jgi:hypothetical protein